MGEWHKVEPRKWSPCDDCQMGWASVSQKIVDGEFYTKTDDCRETCERYQKWLAGDLAHEIVMERKGELFELAKY